jgi:hypothetical protein
VLSNEALDNGDVPLNCVLLMFLETAHGENKDEGENASHSQYKFDSCPTVLVIVPVSWLSVNCLQIDNQHDTSGQINSKQNTRVTTNFLDLQYRDVAPRACQPAQYKVLQPIRAEQTRKR